MSAENANNASFDDEPKKLGTRVFKKSSPNGKVRGYRWNGNYFNNFINLLDNNISGKKRLY